MSGDATAEPAEISDNAYIEAGLQKPSKKFKAYVAGLPSMVNKTVAITGTTTGTGKVMSPLPLPTLG